MEHKFFSIKELKQSLEYKSDCENDSIIDISLVPKKGPAFFSYKGLNMN